MPGIPNPESMGDLAAQLNQKTFAAADSMLPLASAQNQISTSKRLDIIAENAVASWANRMVTPDPIEAVSVQKMMTGHDGIDAALVAAIAQAVGRNANNTNPPA